MTDNHTGIDTSAEGLTRLEDDLIALGEGVFFAEINELPKVQMDTEHARLLIDAARALSAKLTAAREALAWRPIETVDYGYKFLAAGKINGLWAIRICALEYGVVDQNGDKFHAELWMPLPPAPTTRDASGGV